MSSIQACAFVASTGTTLAQLVAASSGKRVVVRSVQVLATTQATVKLFAGTTDTNFWIDSNKAPVELIGADGRPELVLPANTALQFKLDRAGTDVQVSVIYDTVREGPS